MKKRKRPPKGLTPSKDVSEHPGLTMTLGSVTFKGSLASVVRQYDSYRKRRTRP